MSEFVIKPRRRRYRRRWGVVVTVLLLLAFGSWLLLPGIDGWHYVQARLGTGSYDGWLRDANQELEQENLLLQGKIMMQEQTINIDKQAAGVAQAAIKDLQDEIHNLKGELQFYHEVMDAAATTRGLDVQGLYIRPRQHSDGYRLKLILTHVGKADTLVEGKVNITLEGTQDGSAKIIDMREISIEKELMFDYSFRNFQRFECNFVLPEHFQPQHVSVNLSGADKKASKLRRVFDWVEATTER
ncbi:MAG: DUF6776 family protein [Gammaproteobacteria bacterium]